MPSAPTRVIALWTGWVLALLVMVQVLLPSRDTLPQAHVALLLLLLVLGASSTLGFVAGMTIAVAAFGLLTYFFELPFDTLDLPHGVDLIELFSFLIVATTAAWLLTMAQSRARVAELRAREIEKLAAERVELVARAVHADALREADRLKDTLLATVSHDLRTPLTTIRALAERRGAARDADWSLVSEEAQRLSQVVDELLDYSRIRGNVLPVRLETYPVEDLIGAVVRAAAGVIGTHPLRTSIRTSGPIIAARIDLSLATRVLVNLCENAAKHGSPGTPIEMLVQQDGAAVSIRVRNAGAPVSADVRDRIFEAFVRGPHGSARAGVGLGLTIARALAEAQGGSLVLNESVPPPTTEFVFTVASTEFEEEFDDALPTLRSPDAMDGDAAEHCRPLYGNQRRGLPERRDIRERDLPTT